MTAVDILKPLCDFIEIKVISCDFVGISNDREVFVSFDSDDPDVEYAAKKKIKEEFGDRIGRVTTVVQTRITDLQQMVDDLNAALEDEQRKQQPQLLGIEEF